MKRLYLLLIILVLFSSCTNFYYHGSKKDNQVDNLHNNNSADYFIGTNNDNLGLLSDNRFYIESSSLQNPGLDIRDSYIEKKFRVAVWLPLSGSKGKIGNILLNSMTMALLKENSKIEFVLFNTADKLFDPNKALNQVIEENINVVIGPVFSEILEKISGRIRDGNTIFISFSNNKNLLNHRNIFLSGFFPKRKIEKVVSYLQNFDKKMDFSIIAPNSIHGIEMSNLAKDVVLNQEGNFIPGAMYIDGQNLKNLSNNVIDSYVVSEEDNSKIYPKNIFIIGNNEKVAEIASHIDKKDIQLISTSSKLYKQSNLLVPELYGLIFVETNLINYKDFTLEYKNIFNTDAIRIATIAYDLVNFMIHFLRYNRYDTVSYDDFIKFNHYKGFVGIDGLFIFTDDGEIRRNFNIVEINKDGFKILQKPLNLFFDYDNNTVK